MGIQRSANFKSDGSMTLLILANEPKEPIQTSQEERNFTIDDFKPYFKSNPKFKTRLELLLQKNIPLNLQNCKKLNIPTPKITSSHTKSKQQIKEWNEYTTSLKFIDDLISMTDGQIYLQTTTPRATTNKLHKNALKVPKYPPINIKNSLTRIGIGKDTSSQSDAKALSKIASGLRLELLYALDNNDQPPEEFLTEKKRIRCQAYFNIMQQQQQQTRSLADSCILLLAVTFGYMDKYAALQQ